MLFDVVFCNDSGILRIRVTNDSAGKDAILRPVYHNMLTMSIGDYLLLNDKYYIVRLS